MTSTRCGSCGLVNWQEETACKRCGTALGVAEPYRTTGYSGLRTPQQTDVPLWSGGVKGLGIVAAVSLLTTVIRGVSGPGLSLLVGMPEMLVGSFAMLAGVLMLYAAMFRVSLAWVLVSIFVPFGAFVFVATHWYETKRAFAILALGTLAGFGGMLTAFGTVPSRDMAQPPRPTAPASAPAHSSR